MLSRALPIILLLVSSIGGCSADNNDEAATTGDDANLVTQAEATRLKVPLEILNASFFIKPTPIDQSMVGVVLGDRVAFADGATSEALPKLQTLDKKAFAALPSTTVTVGEERYGAIFDHDALTNLQGERLAGRAAPPMLAPSLVRVGMICRVFGPDMDMYASGPPRVISLEGKVDRIRDSGVITVKTTQSTGGDMSLLVCNDKLAGIRAGTGSQGVWHDYHLLDRATLDAFTAKRTQCIAQRSPNCR